MKDTDYLVSGNTNKERILNSITEAEDYKVSRNDIDMIEPVIDSDVVIKMLKATCAVLINFKLNERMGKQ